MKYSVLSTTSQPRSAWLKFASASLIALAVAGCGGGSDGAPGATGAAGAAGATGTPGADLTARVNVGSNKTPATATAAAAWKALDPRVTITGATIASPPVVNFSVVSAAGLPVVGLANYSPGNTDPAKASSVPALTNVNFTLAKLVPGANGEPSKWVNYNVTKFPTVAQKTAAPTVLWYGAFPQVDKEGTLVDHGDGSYTYTFARDPKQAAAIVAALPDATNATKADLGDVSYDDTTAKLTHRVGVIITGNAPGTGTNNPKADATGFPAAVAMDLNGNATYDFIPATGKAVAATDASRDIVNINTCASCHDKKGIGHTTRRDPKLCVTCHTDQTKYTFAETTKTGTVYSGNYGRVGGEAAFTFPRMIHQYHMGKRLTNTGYNLNNHCKPIGTDTKKVAILGTNLSACFNTVVLPQDVGNCTVCHDGAATGAKAAKDGDNYKNVPSIIACGSCHDGINFATGLGKALGAKGTLVGGHVGGTATNSAMCTTCHKPADIVTFHTTSATRSPDTIAAKRTASATISSVTIDATPVDKTKTSSTTTITGTGNVTVKFTISDNGTLLKSGTDISGLAFTFAKLNAAANGSSTNWQSYTGKTRGTPPVVQGYAEAVNVVDTTTNYPVVKATAATAPGELSVDATTGVWTYIFRLDNASTAPGNITKIDSVYFHGSTNVLTGVTDPTKRSDYAVSYDWWTTHRVGMEFSRGPKATAVGNKFNAINDWVPTADSTRSAQTRNIVSMNSCATCHGEKKIHKGFTTEYCVTCHNQNTYDPSSGVAGSLIGTKPVDLQVIVHKLHMGNQLPSVIAGTPYTINVSHNYSNVGFPGVIKDCAVCHSATATKANGTTPLENAAAWYKTPTKRACVTCHDSDSAAAHIDQNSVGGETCVTCHGENSSIGADVRTVHQ